MPVSVIIVVKNGERYLAKAIDSVLEQTCQPNEIIVVDGKSTDRTPYIAQSYPDVRYICQVDEGLANARNTGIDAATGVLVAFLDHDDYWTLDKLDIQVDCFIVNPEIQYSYARAKLFSETGCKLRRAFNKYLFNNDVIARTPGTLVVRKSLFKKIGNFNPELKIACDFEWFVRAKDCNALSNYVPRILLHKRIHDANLSNNVEINKDETLSVIKKSLVQRRTRD